MMFYTQSSVLYGWWWHQVNVTEDLLLWLDLQTIRIATRLTSSVRRGYIEEMTHRKLHKEGIESLPSLSDTFLLNTVPSSVNKFREGPLSVWVRHLDYFYVFVIMVVISRLKLDLL